MPVNPLPLETLIQLARLDWVDVDFCSDHFPNPTIATACSHVALFSFRYRVYREEVQHELGKRGLRGLTAYELLAYASKAKHVNRQTVAFGQAWEDGEGIVRIPSLLNRDGQTWLSLAWADYYWESGVWFAGALQRTSS